MQYTVLINQTKALEWGLNAQQAMLFSFLYGVPSWADARVIDGVVFYNISKSKVIAELPLLTTKPDTIFRLEKQLEEAGIIEMTSAGNRTYIRITDKGKGWAMDYPDLGSEKYPSFEPKGRKNIRGKVGKISEQRSEKYPTNHSTNNQGTSNQCERSPTQPAPPMPGPPNSPHYDAEPMSPQWEPNPDIVVPSLQRSAIPEQVAQLLAQDPELVNAFRNHQLTTPGRVSSASGWNIKLATWLQRDWQRLGRPATPMDYRNARGFNHAANSTGYRTSPTANQRDQVHAASSDWQDTSWADGLI